jgi:serine/threonine protein kinase
MAEIYRAIYHGDGGFVRTLAVKRILPQWTQDPQFIAMLQDEAKLLVKLQHQNIVQVFELGDDNGVFYISMEYVEGVDLRRLLNAFREHHEKIPPKFVYWIISDILRALAFAHSRVAPDGQPIGIVHRDISPQNILIARHGEVKVADFGIAKGRHRETQTSAGQLKGKFAYMSPEQACGEAIDSRSDLFSLGILFFEMLTGARLFEGDSDMDVLRKVQDAVIPPGWERDVAPEVRAILRKCLKKNPQERFQTAEEILAVLSQYVHKINCQIFGFEFAPYLQRLFPLQSNATVVDIASSSETIERVLPPNTPFVPQGSCFAKLGIAGVRPRSYCDSRGLAAGENGVPVRRHPLNRFPLQKSLYGVAILCVAFVITPQKSVIEATAMVIPKTAIGVPVPPLVPTAVATPPLAPEKVAVKGKLSVQVRPWGYVTIPGVVTRKESPIAVSVVEGQYQVKVFYEPTQQWLSARATVKSNGHTTCLTSFGESPRILCR